MNNFNKVFKFTIFQVCKTKSYKISTMIILLMTIIGVSLINIIPAIKSNNTDKNSVKDDIKINTVYYKNNSDLNFIESIESIFPDIGFKETNESDNKLNEEILNTKNSEVYVKVDNDKNSYLITLVKPPNSKLVTESDATTFMSALRSTLESTRLLKLGVPLDKIGEINTPIQNEIIVAGEKNVSIEEQIAKTVLPVIISMVLFYMIYFYGYLVASSIVSEKTSRVMELLLTSLKPVELIVGKCVAMGVVSLIQFILIIVVSILSYGISGSLVKNFINSSVTTINISAIFSAISPLDIMFILIFFILGYIIYALCNVLAGSTVSKVEDLNMAMAPVSMLGVIGFYIAIIALSINSEIMVKLAKYIPFASPFYLPAAMISNNLTISEIIISLTMIIVFIIALIIFTQKVYSVAILHTGNRLKIKDLFRIFKTER